jgi:serine/threonine protein kinase
MMVLELSGRTLGGLLMREPIGHGGHGVVYRCEQRKLGRDLVVKVRHARPEDYAGQDRFLREVRLAAQLQHPFAAHVYDFGVEDDGVWWIAMELVQGVTLGACGLKYIAVRPPLRTNILHNEYHEFSASQITAHLILAAGFRLPVLWRQEEYAHRAWKL